MTLSITDLGDVWTYEQYSVTRDYDLGLSVEVTTIPEKAPWIYAAEVLVDVQHDMFDVEFEGIVNSPEIVFTSEEPARVTVIVSEGLFV